MIWVLDTSSLIEIKYKLPGGRERKRILRGLADLVDDEVIIYPHQVVEELDAYEGDKKSGQLVPWAKRNREVACQHDKQAVFTVASSLLQDPQIQRLLDPAKTGGPEEADIYVLALAVLTRDNGLEEVGVLTDDFIDGPKLSLATACGLNKIVPLRIVPFLRQQKILGS